MNSEPIGGFPSIIRSDVKVNEKTLESRGFAASNIVSIGNIMESKKKENLFLAFGNNEEDGVDLAIEGLFYNSPHEYDGISYSGKKKKK